MFAREVPFQSNTINMYRLDPHPKASPSALVTPIAPLCLFYSTQVQLPLIIQEKLIHITCSMYNFKCKFIQTYFSRDFKWEKCCRHRDSNPRPSDLVSSGIEPINNLIGLNLPVAEVGELDSYRKKEPLFFFSFF